MKTTNILIADDHKMFREGIISILSKEKQINVVGEASNGKEVIEAASILSIDVIIMDIDMGESNGIETTRTIKNQYPDINILILSMISLRDFILQALENGASGYVLKNAGKEELLTAIKTVASGDSYYSKEVSSILLEQIGSGKSVSRKKGEIPLSPREIEVLKLIAQEFSSSEIAARLFISARTVDTHRRNLLEKLNLKNNVGLTKYALNKGFIQ